MAQPNSKNLETWVKAAREDQSLLFNQGTAELFKGNTISINEPGQVCHVYDYQISNYITDYDDRRINGLAGTNPQGADGWSASAYGVFQDVRVDHRVYALGRHRSLGYRLYEEMQYSGDIGYYGTATQSSEETNGTMFDDIGTQMAEVKSRVDKEVIGVDMDNYNMCMACNGHLYGRVVPKEGFMDQIFDGDADHFDWVAQPGPYNTASLPPRFAPIQCMEFDLDCVMETLENLRIAWDAVGIDSEQCIICMDPRYALPLRRVIWGTTGPLQSNKDEMIEGVKKGYKIDGFNFCFDVKQGMYPKIYVDDNLNVVHSKTYQPAFDKYINSITPQDGDPNPLLTKLIASNRMGVNNYIRTDYDPDTNEFVKTIWNYPLGQTGAVDYFGEKIEVEYKHYKKGTTYPYSEPGQGYGLPGKGEASEGYVEATGPKLEHGAVPGQADKKQVIGLAFLPKAIQTSQFWSDTVTADGITRGKFTEMCWDVKYDCWVIEQYAAGVMPILDIKDTGKHAYAVEARIVDDVTVKNAVDAEGANVPIDTHAVVEPADDAEFAVVPGTDANFAATVSPATGANFDATVEPADGADFAATITPASGASFDGKVTNTDADPVKTKEVTAANKKANK